MKVLSKLLAATVLLHASLSVQAEDIKVLSAMGMKSVLETVKADYEAASGNRLTITYDTAGLVRKRIQDGERPDVVFVQKTWMDTLKNADLLVNDSVADLAHSSIGLVARAGTPKKDISTPAQFVQVLREAQSIGYTDPKAGGLSGSHFARLSTQLGIEDEIRRKSVLGSPMARVSKGEVEYAVLQLSEIVTLKDVVYMGPFPEALQETTPTSAAVVRGSTVAASAADFLRHLKKPVVADVFRAKGMTPSGAGS